MNELWVPLLAFGAVVVAAAAGFAAWRVQRRAALALGARLEAAEAARAELAELVVTLRRRLDTPPGDDVATRRAALEHALDAATPGAEFRWFEQASTGEAPTFEPTAPGALRTDAPRTGVMPLDLNLEDSKRR